MRQTLLTIALLCATAVSWPALAHDGTDHDVEELSKQLDAASNPDLLLQRADAYRIQDRFDAALRDLDAARRRGASRAVVFLAEGRTRLEAGQLAAAEAALTEHLDLRETFLGRWLRGRVRVQLGRPTEALVDYDRAAALGTGLDVFLERGELLETLGRPEAATRNYREALQRLGDTGVVRERLARRLLDLGRAGEAVQIVNPMIDRLPVRTRWLLLRARAHEQLGDRDAADRDRNLAVADADRALDKRRSPLLLVERARAHAALGRDGAALEDLDEALHRAPHYEAAQRLAVTLGRRGTP